MSLFVQKLLIAFLSPLNQSLLIFSLSFLLFVGKRSKIAVTLLLFGVIWLFTFSLPYTAEQLIQSLEDLYPVISIDDIPSAKAIVVLGGAISPAPFAGAGMNLHAAADRPVHAARLFHSGKAPLILVSAGALPWMQAAETEADATAEFLREMGVPDNKIIKETRSGTTRQNAQNTKQILKTRNIHRIILVTSAWHMRRAEASFEHLGFDVIPAATDYGVLRPPFSKVGWLPSVETLKWSEIAIQEKVGYQVYRYRGWIKR